MSGFCKSSHKWISVLARLCQVSANPVTYGWVQPKVHQKPFKCFMLVNCQPKVIITSLNVQAQLYAQMKWL